MRRLYILIAAATLSFVTQAQIMLTPYVDSTVSGMNTNNGDLVINRLRSIISAAGMTSSYNSRFVLATRVNLLDREFTNGIPVRMIQRLSITLAIGDGISGACFGSTTFEVKGIGETEQAAMLSACRNIPRTNSQIKELVSTAKTRIISYYEENAANIIAKAKSLEAGHKFEDALLELSAIPQECTRYKEALSLASKISSEHIKHTSAMLLAEAQAVWAADPNPGPSAELAMEILSQIDPSTKEYQQANTLMKSIETRNKAAADQYYKDAVAYENAKLQAYTTLETARLQAARDVAVAHEENKPKISYNITNTWWLWW